MLKSHLSDLLKYYAEMQNVFKEFEVQETIPTTQQLKDAFNLRMKDSSGEQQEEAQISFNIKNDVLSSNNTLTIDYIFDLLFLLVFSADNPMPV